METAKNQMSMLYTQCAYMASIKTVSDEVLEKLHIPFLFPSGSVPMLQEIKVTDSFKCCAQGITSIS